MKVFGISLLLIVNFYFIFASEDSLQLIHVVYRHGDRTPVHFYANDPYSNQNIFWPEGLGELTKKGMETEYKLGGWLRRRYGNFIGEVYNNEEMYAISTDYDRTLMSANTVLASFYYPTNKTVRFNESVPWMPTPVHTSASGDDVIINVDAACPRIAQEVQKATNMPEVVKFNKDHQKLYDYLTEKCGDDRQSIIRVAFLLDTLYVEKNNGLKLPEWVTDDIFKQLEDVANYSFWIDALTIELKRLRAGPLLQQFASHMDKKASGELGGRKIYMYSGHDSTVSVLLHAMGAFDGRAPPYAATVLVELHKIKSEYFVKMFYRNDTNVDAYPIAVKGCDHLCPLKKWHALLRKVTPIDWHDECYIRNPQMDAILINIETGLFILVVFISALWVVRYLVLRQTTKWIATHQNNSPYVPIINNQASNANYGTV